jgi:hypothetical protein
MITRIICNVCLLFLFSAVLLMGATAFAEVNKIGVLVGADVSSTTEVQALKEGHDAAPQKDEIIGDTGKMGLGGYDLNEPLFLSENSGESPTSTVEVQALKEGVEVLLRREESIGETGNAALGGYDVNNPWFSKNVSSDKQTATNESGKMQQF